MESGATTSIKNGGSVDEFFGTFFVGGVEMTLHYFGGSVDDMWSFWGVDIHILTSYQLISKNSTF